MSSAAATTETVICARCAHIDSPEKLTPRQQGEALVVALAGNPNCGKTTLFNALTGARQKTGNWPGTTVEQREGSYIHDDQPVRLVDLPGAYSLHPFSPEERVAADYLQGGEADALILVLDASNLERNLYLAVQAIETGQPTLVALNMLDTAHARGLHIDLEALARGLGVDVAPMIAVRGEGVDALRDLVMSARAPLNPALVNYGPDLEVLIGQVCEGLCAIGLPASRGAALRLIEGEAGFNARVRELRGGADLLTTIADFAARRLGALGEDLETSIAARRYAAISTIARSATRRDENGPTLSDRVDALATHPLWGMLIFAVLMWFVFQAVANVSAHYLDWVDSIFGGPLTRWAVALTGLLGLNGGWVESLLVDGLLAGLGGVLVFVPPLAFMYVFTAILEDSGYMARAALMADRFMRAVGLNGHAFIPMLLGFGCNVPGIYAARALKDPRERLLTALLIPYMSCGARLPVYVIIGAAFFGQGAGTLVFAMYLLGVLVAVGMGALLRRTALPGEQAPFLIELPPYRLPQLRNVWLHTLNNTKSFVENALGIVMAVTLGVWLLLSIPVSAPGARFADVPADQSAMAALGSITAPLLKLAGFGSWQAGSALVTGVVAKEIIVATLSTVYVGGADEETVQPQPLLLDLRDIALGFITATVDTGRALISLLPGVDLFGPEDEPLDAALIGALRASFTPLSAVAFCIFTLLTVPCMVTIGALRQEFGMKWALFSVASQLFVSWLAAVIVYQGGLLLGFA